MTSLHLEVWTAPVVAGCLGVAAVGIRCLTLLVGLLIALSKAAQGDRPDIFREFSIAMRGEYLRTRNRPLIRAEMNGKALIAPSRVTHTSGEEAHPVDEN